MAPTVAFRGQHYKDIKKKYVAQNKLFIDPEFQPNESSLYYSKSQFTDLEWKRPGDIVDDPHLFVEGISSDDVSQGILGNCWFVAACSALTHHKELWTKVIPDAKDQEWDPTSPKDYCGVFHFTFWQFGRWVDVVIDDLLPTRHNRLIFAHSRTRNEFWSALLEKAFAKLHGCYEALIGGSLAEAFVDITGGVPETIDLSSSSDWKLLESRVRLFDELHQCYEDKALMATAIAAKSQSEVEEVLDCGLVKGHSYAITDVRKLALDAEMRDQGNYQLEPELFYILREIGLVESMKIGHCVFVNGIFDKLFSTPERVLMIRLRNPWGEKEWCGPWSDGSKEWALISEEQQADLGLKIEEDGEFWMTFEDFCHYFTDISICHHVNNSRWIVFPPSSKSYHEYVFHGAWVSDHRRGIYSNRSGGCVNFTDTFLQNPQYRFDVPDSVSEDKDQMIMFSLMQRDVRERKVHGVRHMTIGLHAMKVEENRKYRMHQIQRGVGTSDYVNTRSVFLKLNKLKPGRYIVMPTTFAPGETGEFMLRIYSTYGCSPAELTKDESTGGRLQKCMGMCKKEAICVTRLTIYRATTLQKEDKWGSVDPYVYIDCEGHKMQSPAVKDSYNPVWNYAVMFHRRCPEKPIKIDIYNDNMLKDSHMGTVFVSAPVTNDCQRHELSLHEAGGTPTAPAPLRSGTLVLEVATYDDLLRL